MSSWLEDSTAGCAAASATASALRASGHTFTRPSELPVTSAERVGGEGHVPDGALVLAHAG